MPCHVSVSYTGGLGSIPANICGDSGRQIGTGTGFSQISSISPVTVIPPLLHLTFYWCTTNTAWYCNLPGSLKHFWLLPWCLVNDCLDLEHRSLSDIFVVLFRSQIHSLDQENVTGRATCYVVDGPGIESHWGPDSPHPFRQALGPTQSHIQLLRGLFLRLKQ